MSNQNELQTVHHALKDIERQIGKISGRLGWILILAIASVSGMWAQHPADLLLLVKAVATIEGVGRALDPSFKMIQHAAPFVELLAADPAVSERLPAAELKACFDPAFFLRNVDAVFKRVGLLP